MWKRQTPGVELQPGDVFGPFRLDRELGRGGMGIVFRATRLADGEVVALKVLRGELSGDTVFRRRFLHEARAASAVTNRHLVPIVDAGEDRVEFEAAYERGGTPGRLHERSRFERRRGRWVYVDGEVSR